jgi:radical SAM superfamily enzyme YgiQ (UPF0313 family)
MRILLVFGSREIVHVMVPPLGGAYIAAYLRMQGHDVKLLDLTLSNDFKNDLQKTVANFDPEVIGFSIRNIDSTTYPGNLFFYLPIRNIIQYIKEIVEPHIPIILGGAGFSIFAEEILRDLKLNFGVVGDGELAFAEILKRLEKKEDPKKLQKGICFIDNHGTYHQRPPWYVENLDSLPFPARELLENDEYPIDPLKKDGARWGNLQTKRGCPKNCIYCSYKYIEGQHVRYRSPGKIAEELDLMVNNYGIKKVFIVDSVLNLDYGHLKETCQEIIDHNIDVQWGGNYVPSAEFIDLMPLMKESGATHLATGMESLSDDILNNLRKERSADEAILTAKTCLKLEIEQLIHILIGGPGETLESVRSTFDRLETIGNYRGETWQGDGDCIIFVGLRIYPHTVLQTIAETEGVIRKGLNLLDPKFYLSPKLDEYKLYELVKEYCITNSRWMCPGLGLNNPQGFAELSQLQFLKYQT